MWDEAFNSPEMEMGAWTLHDPWVLRDGMNRAIFPFSIAFVLQAMQSSCMCICLATLNTRTLKNRILLGARPGCESEVVHAIFMWDLIKRQFLLSMMYPALTFSYLYLQSARSVLLCFSSPPQKQSWKLTCSCFASTWHCLLATLPS